MRILKITALMAMASVLMASAALAGGGHCSSQASACTAKQTASCGSAMANCTVEATRLTSGDLVVHYQASMMRVRAEVAVAGPPWARPT